MHETVTCPKCTRHLQLPVEYLGQQVQCPSCETSFIAGAARQAPPVPDAISATPVPLAVPLEIDADPPVPMARRALRLRPTSAGPPPRKWPMVPLLVLLGLFVSVLLGACYLASDRRRVNDFAFVKDDLRKPEPQVMPLNPFVVLPDRMLNADEQREQAKTFFDHFSAVMRNQNLAGESAAFDGDRLVDTMFDEKLIPNAWRVDRHRLAPEARQGVVQTSLYRGEFWAHFEIKTVQQPRLRELVVVTYHANPALNGVLRLRWWLNARDGKWLAHEVESLDVGVRITTLLAAEVKPPRFGGGAVDPGVITVRDAANAVMVKLDHDKAEQLLRDLRPDDLPKPAAATLHHIIGTIRFQQRRFQDYLAACDAAQLAQPDNPGSEYNRTVALNSLSRSEQALKHGRLAQEWFGDDPYLNFEIGLASQNLGRFVEAAAIYRKALDVNPDHRDSVFNLMRCTGPGVKNDDIAARFLKLKHPQDHFTDFAQDRWTNRDAATLLALAEAMRKLDPRNADAHYFAALAHAEQQRIGPALTSFREAVSLQDFEGRLDTYFIEFARSMALHDNAQRMYAEVPQKVRSFRALSEALTNSGRVEDVEELMALHVKQHPDDPYVALYQAEVHLRAENYEQANKAFALGFAKIADQAVQNRFRWSRVRARYQTGDVLGAYRDIGPHNTVFQQLADSCWHDKKAAELAQLVEAHTKNDPGDPLLRRTRWRVPILGKQFAKAGKLLRAALPDKEKESEYRFLTQDFLFDMANAGHGLEGYRLAPDPAEAFDILAMRAVGSHAKDREALFAEHRKAFPKDPLLLMYAGQEAADKKDWAKAAKTFSEGWSELPDVKKPNWTHQYLYARFKEDRAIQAYEETGKRPEHFRKLAGFLLQEKQTDAFERLLEAHRPQRGDDPEFAAYEARLQILRGKPDEAAAAFAAVVKNLPQHDQRGISDRLLTDLGTYDVAVEAYRCIPDKIDAFGYMVFKYRKLERVKELDRLIAEHTRLHPDDARLFSERAELHMLRNEFAEAEKQFLLARERSNFMPHVARSGLVRARIKLGKAVETYHELGANAMTFQDIANQCFAVKDGDQLQKLLAAHRKAFPAAKNLSVWEVEVLWLKKDYAAVVKGIEDERATLLKSPKYRWKCESYLVRSLIRLKKTDEALREAEAIAKEKNGSQVFLALAYASSGGAPRILEFFESKKDQVWLIEDCYFDEDLGPLLRSDAYRTVRDRFPPPPDRGAGGYRDDDWD